MERASLVVQRLSESPFSLFTCTKGPEVICRLGCNIGIELHNDLSEVFVSVLNVKVHVRIVALGVGDKRALLVAVESSLDAAKHTSKCGLFLLFSLHRCFLELFECLSYILIGIIDFVGSHKISLGFLEQSKAQTGDSPSVQSLDVRFSLRIDFQNLVTGSNGIWPALDLDVTHGSVSKAAHIEGTLVLGDVVSGNPLVNGKQCRFLVLGSSLLKALFPKEGRSSGLHFFCFGDALLGSHLPSFLGLFLESQKLDIEQEIGLWGNGGRGPGFSVGVVVSAL
mmetsp:Transcript_8624/g.17919  ORF Transcript_8624/g.17919 Transcript_8624/m.17919 type:complete len:281 (-) Transcript_8624:392-1234(-)